MGLKMQFKSFSLDMITSNDARFNIRGEKLFSSWEDKMLMGGECSLNSLQLCTDSCKEVLRQTMLNQEVTFRKQVNELHRLYMIQKTLMDDFGWREYSGYNFGDARRQSTVGAFANQIRYEPPANGETLSTLPMVGSTHFINNNYLQEGKGDCSRLQQRPIDLQLPLGCYINNVSGGLSKKEEEVKLSLSIGGDSMQKGVQSETLNDKSTQSSSQQIIDLEESMETVSDETNRVLPLGCVTLRTDSFLDESQSCPGRKSFDQGIDDNTLVKDKVDSTFEPVVHLDLNKVHFDEFSIQLNTPTVAYHSAGSSPVCSTTISLKEPNSDSHSCNISSTSAKMNEASDSKACTIDLESLSGPTSDHSEDPDNYGSNTEHENVDLKHQCRDKKGELPEMDILIQNAAVSLIYISLGSSTSAENFITEAKSNDIRKKEKEQPQRSLDSYESIVLKLKESREDDNCVSSYAFEMDTKDCGIKLKRGRRMKDFQKDILPGLASLSRREIWEDVKIMEGVIRSREYKKLQANRTTTNGENWFTPVRCKRSRLNYVGRRYYK